MKIKFDSKKMDDLLSGMIKVISSKSVLPVMSNYKFEVLRDSLNITAMNSQCCVSNRIDVESDFDEQFSFFLDANLFTSFIQKIDGDITMSFKDRNVTIKHSYGKFNMIYGSYDNFPITVYPKEYKSFRINGSVLSSMISEVSVCAMQDGDRPVLSSVCLDITPGKLVVAATDQFKMRVFSTDIDTEDTATMLVSPYISQIMYKFIKGKTVEVRYDEKRTYFVCDDTYIYDINVEGRYANYGMIIDKSSGNNRSCIEVNADEFIGSVRRLCSISNGFVKFTYNENKLSLISKTKIGDGDIEENISVLNHSSNFEAVFNIFQVYEIAQCLKNEKNNLIFSNDVRCLRVEESSNGIDKIFLTMQVFNVNL